MRPPQAEPTPRFAAGATGAPEALRGFVVGESTGRAQIVDGNAPPKS